MAEHPLNSIPESEPQPPEESPEGEMPQALQDAKKEAAGYYDQLLRLKAEFDNYRKRMEREKAEARNWGKQEMLMPLLSLVDVFEQALAQAKSAKDLKHVVSGLEMLHKSFSSFLKDEGIEPILAVGKKFDPHLAEALEQQEVEDHQAGQVLSELQKGYTYQGKVLRPSRVKVGVQKKTESDTNDLK